MPIDFRILYYLYTKFSNRIKKSCICKKTEANQDKLQELGATSAFLFCVFKSSTSFIRARDSSTFPSAP